MPPSRTSCARHSFQPEHDAGRVTTRLAVATAIGLLFAGVTACTSTPPVPCGGPCGEGLECREDRCVEVEVAAAEPEPEPGDKKRRRARKHTRTARKGATDTAPEEVSSSEVPPMPDDSRVPRFDPNADQTVAMDVGGERLGDATFRAEMKELRGAFDRCIADAFARDPSLATGTVEFEIAIAASGKVTGVNATGPARLKDAGGIACLRVAIHKHRFPSWDGPPASTRYELSYD